MKSWQPSKAHLLLLSKFLIGQELKNMIAAYWDGPLGEPAGTAVQRFIALGWLAPATLAAKLGSRFRASDLKPLLKERGLRVSGRMDELIERLIAEDETGMVSEIKGSGSEVRGVGSHFMMRVLGTFPPVVIVYGIEIRKQEGATSGLAMPHPSELFAPSRARRSARGLALIQAPLKR